MKYVPPLSDEQAKAYESMPKTLGGFVVNLFDIPEGQRERYAAEWREWCRKTPRHLWPDWIELWSKYQKAKRK